jgi:glycerophosphoryl diester phosphodiesterase
VVLLRLFSGWLFALPLVLFDDLPPARALRASRERARGRRLALAAWVGGWALAVTAAAVAATSATIWLARAVVPGAVGSIPLLTLAVGAALVVWSLVHLAIHLLGTTTFASLLLVLYRRFGAAGEADPARLDRFERESRGLHIELTRGRLARWTVIGLVAASGIGAYLLHSARLEESVQVLAHRGSSKAAPENSMSAFRQAIADGADWIELDVQETADGEVVVFHDSDFMRLSGVATKMWDARRADLATIDIGSRFAPAFHGERVPTLGEVLDLCKDRVRVLIELKYYGHDQQLEERVAREVESRGMASQIAIMSLELRAVRKMKALRPGWIVGLLLTVSAGNLGQSGADFVAVNAAFASRRFVRRAHSLGMKAFAWTVDDAPTMAAMMGRGFDGVITNRPALAKDVAAARAGLSPALRLLLEAAGILGLKPDIRPL